MLTLGSLNFDTDVAKSGISVVMGKNYPSSSDTDDTLSWHVEIRTLPRRLSVRDFDDRPRNEPFAPSFSGYPIDCVVSDWRSLSGRTFTIGNLGNGCESSFYVGSHENVNDCTIAIMGREALTFAVEVKGYADVFTDYDTSAYGWGPSTSFHCDSPLAFKLAAVCVRAPVSDPVTAAMERLRRRLPNAEFSVKQVHEMATSRGKVFGYSVHLTPNAEPSRSTER